MSRHLIVHQAGPSVSVQDFGRPGFLAFGLSRGGALDRTALYEGAALLGQDPSLAALEMTGFGGVFEATEDCRIALTGAQMRADIDGTLLRANTSAALPKGARLTIGPSVAGLNGYLHIGGGFDTSERLGAKSMHYAAKLGGLIEAGQVLPIAPDRSEVVGLTLDVAPRGTGGEIRVLPSLQTSFFSQAEITRFEATPFKRDPRGNRMGVKLGFDGPGFQSDAGLSVLSEVIAPGDIQITGDGTPFVLLAECGTTGGYPRLGTVLPADLPNLAQTPPGGALRFRFISPSEGLEVERRARAALESLPARVAPLIRDPRDMSDLLSYQLISGLTDGQEQEG